MRLMAVALSVGAMVFWFLALWAWAGGRDEIRDGGRHFRVTGLCPKCGEKINHFMDKHGLGHWHCLACGWEVDSW